MEYAEVTIKQVADECGVSKSTAVRKLKELNLPVITRGGKGTVFLGPESASALAHALMKSRVPEVPSQDEVSDIIGLSSQDESDSIAFSDVVPSESVGFDSPAPDYEPILAMYRDQVRTLKDMNSTLKTQIDQLNQTITAMRSNYESTVSILSSQVDRLNEQIAMMQREKDQLRDELAMSRALEGFHFPWQRDRIVSRYLLPVGRPNGNDDATYEIPS